jgi:hypothetical protein
MKLYTEEQVLNSMLSMKTYIEKYDESVIDSIVEKHLKSLGGIELPSDEEIREVIKPFQNEMDDFDLGFRNGVQWLREKTQGGEQC